MTGRLWPLLLTVCLCACGGNTGFHERSYTANAPFFFLHGPPPTAGEALLRDEDDVYRPMTNLNLAQERDERDMAAGLAPSEPALPAACSLGDRFDRDGAIAYNFDDRQSRLSLNLDMGNVGIGGVEVDRVMVRYRYKLQPGSGRKDVCRYPSGVQGLFGSGYNELVRRQHNTVWDKMRDDGVFGLFQ